VTCADQQSTVAREGRLVSESRERHDVSEIEIRFKGRRLERFVADVDPEDEVALVALLRRRAKELNRPVESMTLRVMETKHLKKEYRA
jgi:hypothetical protein